MYGIATWGRLIDRLLRKGRGTRQIHTWRLSRQRRCVAGTWRVVVTREAREERCVSLLLFILPDHVCTNAVAGWQRLKYRPRICPTFVSICAAAIGHGVCMLESNAKWTRSFHRDCEVWVLTRVDKMVAWVWSHWLCE